jgi:hypothetical protein
LFHKGFFLFIILNQETPDQLNKRYGASKKYKEMNNVKRDSEIGRTTI